jgi:hypothetical protein
MLDEEVKAWDWLVELGCKLFLLLTGFAIVGYGLAFLLAPWIAPVDMWLFVLALEIGAFVWVLHWYLWHTGGRLRLRIRMSDARRQLAGAR